VGEFEAPRETGIAIELTPPTLLRSAHHRDHLRRIHARAGVSTLQHRAADGSRDRIRCPELPSLWFYGTSDVSAWPMDIIEINRLLPSWLAA
jgi:hypothetical protein